MCWAGDPTESEEVIRPFRELRPEVDLVGLMPYAGFNRMIDAPPVPRSQGQEQTPIPGCLPGRWLHGRDSVGVRAMLRPPAARLAAI